MRLLYAAAGLGSCQATFRFVPPAEGHDLTWLVATGGQLAPERVGAAVQALAGCPVYATLVEAHHPDLGDYAPMVLVCLAAGREAAAQQWAGADAGLHVAGRRWRVFPLTQLRPDSRRPPREGAEARRLWDGLLRPGVAGTPRSTAYTMVAERTPLDAAQAICGPPQAQALLRADLDWGEPAPYGAWRLQQRCLGTGIHFVPDEPGGVLAVGMPPRPLPPAVRRHLEQVRRRDSPLAGPFDELATGGAFVDRPLLLAPGEAALLPLAAGGTLELHGPGEQLRVVLACPAVAWVAHPPRAAVVAAREGCTADIAVQVSQLAGPYWVSRLRLRPATQSAASPTGLPAAAGQLPEAGGHRQGGWGHGQGGHRPGEPC